MAPGQKWEVVGGKDNGGILVREGQDLASAQCKERLSTGAIVEEQVLAGERLNFKRLSGTGPDTGWVSLRVNGKSLVVRAAVEGGQAVPLGSGAEMIKQKRWVVVGRGTNDIVQQLLEHLKDHDRDVCHVDPYGASGPDVPKSIADLPADVSVDVVDLCANPSFGKKVIDDCKARGIGNLFIQPGASSPDILSSCKEEGISTHNGCVLVEMH
eukprot:gnl/TRDRNA2_/TRDRNA2_30172_c0_seq1.p1 gnl/TRDRNA2_/TRDRNA2_30172_c0~~gnl/TRDRNA2_/TRDRNA2_30172_c0_seq1.p1  ORF type:complete len:240 (+),score=40.58 gnl/TRDRNA2_/TRDRNA2_30172_c0_seq1:85-720(+)